MKGATVLCIGVNLVNISGLGSVVQSYQIYVIPKSVVTLKSYVISFSYSIQNYVSDERVNETYEME
jgi:hypothetical protein